MSIKSLQRRRWYAIASAYIHFVFTIVFRHDERDFWWP